MFQSIHVRVGYSIFKMSACGPIGANTKNLGQIDALLKHGNRFSAPFGGFINAENVIGLKRVKLLDVQYICSDIDAEQVEYSIPKHHYVVGTYIDKQFCILLFDGSVRHYLMKDADQDDKNNVYGLF
jgi:hypothetical protein